MKDLIISLLGEYTTKTDASGNLIGGLAGLDYEWIIGAVAFVGITLIVLKLISSLIVSFAQGR